MPTFRYNKLVRDNIRAMHEADGHIVDGRTLHGLEHKAALRDKFPEESAELPVQDEPDEHVAEELADLLQLTRDSIELNGFTLEQIEAIRERKLVKKGGFLQGVFIDTVTIPNEDDPMVVYLRSDPDKYPELEQNA